MKSNPRFLAATPVDPDPMNGSKTVPLGGVTSLIRYSIRAVGLTVGWKLALVGLTKVRSGQSQPSRTDEPQVAQVRASPLPLAPMA